MNHQSLRNLYLKNRLFIILLVIVLFCYGSYRFYHRLPRTDNAFVVANIRPISAQVSGYLTHIYVRNNEYVKKGQPLFTIFKAPYELAYQEAEKNYALAQLHEKVLPLEIAKNQAAINAAYDAYSIAADKSKRAEKLAIHGFEAQQQTVDLSKIAQQKYALWQESHQQGAILQEQLKSAEITTQQRSQQLMLAKIHLQQTTVYARSNGTVNNMHLAIGAGVTAQQTLFSFVNTQNWWVQANMKETELAHVRAGDKASIKLLMYPHHVFQGVVSNTGWGVGRQQTATHSGLSTVADENQWILLPQRFPVQIKILNPSPAYPLHVGASADVIIHISDKATQS